MTFRLRLGLTASDKRSRSEELPRVIFSVASVCAFKRAPTSLELVKTWSFCPKVLVVMLSQGKLT